MLQSPAGDVQWPEAATRQRREGARTLELTIATRESGSVTIITLQGKLCLGEDTRRLRETVKALVDGGRKLLLLEMGKLTYVDSAGLGALVGCFSCARTGEGALKLLGITKPVRESLTMTRLLPVFEVFEKEAQAIASFASPATGPGPGAGT